MMKNMPTELIVLLAMLATIFIIIIAPVIAHKIYVYRVMHPKRNYYKGFHLIQWIERGRIYTYLPEYPDFPCIAIFRVKLKDNRTRMQKLFLKRRARKYWSRHLIASQYVDIKQINEQ